MTTPHTVPSAPTNLNVIESTPDTLSLSWDEPVNTSGNIISYTITLTPSGRVIVVDGSDGMFNVTGLTPYTLYTVSVSANTSAGGGECVTVTARTAEDCESH